PSSRHASRDPKLSGGPLRTSYTCGPSRRSSGSPGADVRIFRPGEGERERGARVGSDGPEPVLLRCFQLQARLEDAVRVRANEPDSLPRSLRALQELDLHELLVARPVAAPDG